MKFFSSVFAFIAIGLVILSTLLHTSFLFVMAMLKWLLPLQAIGKWLSWFLIKIAESWVALNSWLIDVVTPTKFIVTGLDSLKYEGWYLVISNHQSWVDTTVNQYFGLTRMPLTRFFTKWELIFIPFVGQAFKILGFIIFINLLRKLIIL